MNNRAVESNEQQSELIIREGEVIGQTSGEEMLPDKEENAAARDAAAENEEPASVENAEPAFVENAEEKAELTDSGIDAAIEAILFTMGESVEIADIAKALEVPANRVEESAERLSARYSGEEYGIKLVRLENALQLCTKPDMYGILIKIAQTPKKLKLSDSVLETLSIIAYKQPVTKSDIESIRGVNSDFAVDRLLSYGLIAELGRKEAPGRPILFGTTEQFLRSFGVRSVEDLPMLSPVEIEEFKTEAEQEVNTRLGI